MKTKRIKTKKEKMLLLVDLGVFLFCTLRCLSYYKMAFEAYDGFKAFGGSPLTQILLVFYMLWLFILLFMLKNFIIIAIYLAYRVPKKRILKANTKYEVIENIDYFRDRFNNITPSEISLLTDLEIETKKDVSASILNLYNKNLISFDVNKKIVVNNNKDLTDIKESDKYLYNLLLNNNLNSVSIREWKEIAEKEAIEDGLVVEKNKSKRFGLSNSMTVIAKTFLIFFLSCMIGALYVFTPTFQKVYDKMEVYEKRIDGKSNDQIVELIKTDKEFSKTTYDIYLGSVPLAIIGVFVMGSLFALIALPFYLKARNITYKYVDANDKFDRTTEGKILVEQISGMKNFIHDFSDLSDKEKEAVVVWNDFIIYAILLEENEKIINEIFKLKNMNIEVLNNVNNITSIVEK